MKTNQSTSLKQAQRTYVQDITKEAKSFTQCLTAAIRATRPASLAHFFEAANVPAQDASNTSIKQWAQDMDIMRRLPYYEAKDGSRTFITLTPDRKKALTLTEADGIESIHNLSGVEREILNSTKEGCGAIKEALFYVIKKVKRPIILERNANIIRYKVDAAGRRCSEVVDVVYYIADNHRLFMMRDVAHAYLEALGVPAAIAEAEAAEMEQKAAIAVLKATAAAAKAVATAAKAGDAAKALQSKAAEKIKAAEKVAESNKMTATEAASVVASAAKADGTADEQAATAPTPQRKKSNTRTKASQVITK